MNILYPYLIGQRDEDCFYLGLDLVPKQTIFNILQRIDRKPNTYNNAFTMKKMALLPENQVNYVESIVVKRDTADIGMSRKEVIQFVSELIQAKSFSSRESLVLTHSGEAADSFENAWEGGCISGN